MLFNDDIFKNINSNLTIEKTQNPKTIPSNMECQWKLSTNDNILYIVEKVLKKANQR